MRADGLLAAFQGPYSPNEDVKRESDSTGKVREKGRAIRLFSIMHSLIQLIANVYLLCVRHFLGTGGKTINKIIEISATLRL